MKIAKKMLEKMITNSSLGSHEACSYEKKADPTFFFLKKKKKKNFRPLRGFYDTFWVIFQGSEAIAQRCSVKKVFLEISQNSMVKLC